MKPIHCFLLICSLLGTPAVGAAQEPFPRQPGKDQPKLPSYWTKKAEEGLRLPPAPAIPDRYADGPGFFLEGVVFEGNTVFSDEELQQVAEEYIGKRVGLADLEELRYRLTRLYTDHGYINSGALLKPGQRVDDGMVTFTLVEGRLDEIRLSGLGRLEPGYVKKRLWPDAGRPFSTDLLQKRFQLLLQDPLIERMDGRIRPGAAPGEAVLEMDITRERPYGLSFEVDNHRPPNTGSIGGSVTGWLSNPTGYGGLLSASYGASEGSNEVDLGYSVFVSPGNTRFSVDYSRSETSVVEEPLVSVDIDSEFESLDLSLMHPFYRTLRRELKGGVFLSLRESRTFLLDRPFSFSPGAVEGASRVTVLRLVQSFVDRTADHALALRSSFSFGLDLFEATVHGDGRPDGTFFSWLGQIQYAHRLGEMFGSLVLRGDVQLTSEELLTLERFALGGAATVRGYRENELVRDNGFDVSIEWRYPLWKASPGKGDVKTLHLAPFMDFGAAWNKGEDVWDNRLHSVGVGLLWESKWLDARLYFAHDIEKAEPRQDEDLQDDGIHFLFSLHY
ncbi:MAG: BamA/TamA family outer membrane protein [Desulfohalobiaceae bacterium]|nr:BamA/TamA family outer membrane protein [Desulfohalobiaceae bacterium]